MGVTVSAAKHLEVDVHSRRGVGRSSVDVRSLVLAGYTGRDRANVLAHIAELEKAGVAPPARVPSVFVVPVGLLTTEDSVTVSGPHTSGEAEFVVIASPAGRLVGIGSDHTDRALEKTDIDRAKAACPKVLGRDVWRYEEVADHWDAIEIRSWSTVAGTRRLYQEGSLAEFLEIDRMISELGAAGQPEALGRVLFGGTLPLATGGFEYGDRFEAELRDPLLGRALKVAYAVQLP